MRWVACVDNPTTRTAYSIDSESAHNHDVSSIGIDGSKIEINASTRVVVQANHSVRSGRIVWFVAFRSIGVLSFLLVAVSSIFVIADCESLGSVDGGLDVMEEFPVVMELTARFELEPGSLSIRCRHALDLMPIVFYCVSYSS